MKFFLIFGLVSTLLVTYLLQDVISCPVHTFGSNHSSHQNCNFTLEKQSQFVNAWGECQNETEVIGEEWNSTEYNSKTFDEILKSKGYKDNCLSKCFLEKMDWYHQNGSLKINNIEEVFKSNAPAKIESKRIKEWKECASDLKKWTKDALKKAQKAKAGTNSDEGLCVAAAKFIACGVKEEVHLSKKCVSKFHAE